jgi:DNA polymerase II small subunit
LSVQKGIVVEKTEIEVLCEEAEVEIVDDPSLAVRPTGVEGFSQLFKNRYEKLVKILMERPEGRQLTKISRINLEKGNVKVAGLVFSKKITKSGGLEFVLDDDTGKASLLALSSEAKKSASEIALDQCVMVDADAVKGKLIVKNIIQPDVPSKLASTSKKTTYAVFLSDLHIGSNKFMDGAFDRFLEWLAGQNGKLGQEDEEIIRRLKYVVIGGDVVDGVGVFPNQEYELAEQNIFKQYEMVSEKLKLIPRHLQIFMIPGNHDATRQALPQPMIPKKYAESLYALPNLRMLGDPCLFKLHGASILVYHGRSLDDVLATTPGLTYEKPEEAMKVLLRARHLAPIFGLRTPIAPEIEDHLVITEVPDIFHCGHVHTVGFETYKSTLIINSGTWQGQTGYQANLGISPRPGIVPIVNLGTMDVVWREFLTSSSVSSTQGA